MKFYSSKRLLNIFLPIRLPNPFLVRLTLGLAFGLTLGACQKRQKSLMPVNVLASFLEKSEGQHQNQIGTQLRIGLDGSFLISESFFIDRSQPTLCRAESQARLEAVFQIPENTRGHYSEFLGAAVPSDATYVLKYLVEKINYTHLPVDRNANKQIELNKACEDNSSLQFSHLMGSNTFIPINSQLGENIEVTDYSDFSSSGPNEKWRSFQQYQKMSGLGTRVFGKIKEGSLPSYLNGKAKFFNSDLRFLDPRKSNGVVRHELLSIAFKRSWHVFNLEDEGPDRDCHFSLTGNITNFSLPIIDFQSPIAIELMRALGERSVSLRFGSIFKLESANLGFTSFATGEINPKCETANLVKKAFEDKIQLDTFLLLSGLEAIFVLVDRQTNQIIRTLYFRWEVFVNDSGKD